MEILGMDAKQLLNLINAQLVGWTKFLGGRGFPLCAIQLLLTWDCNLRCKYCIVKEELDMFSKKQIDLRLVKNLMEQIQRNHFLKPWVHLTGGEPLLHKEFTNIARLLFENRINWTLATNGYFLKKYAEAVCDFGCFCVNVSIDDIGPAHDEIREKEGAFKRAIEGIKFLEGFKTMRNKRNPHIAINCTINEKNCTRLHEIYDYLESLPVHSISFQHLSFGPQRISGVDLNRNIAEKIDIVGLASSLEKLMKKKGRVRINLPKSVRKNDLENYYKPDKGRVSGSCVFPWLFLFVAPDGRCYVCDRKIGDLKKQNMQEVWNGDEMHQFRRSLLKGKALPCCFRCCWNIPSK